MFIRTCLGRFTCTPTRVGLAGQDHVRGGPGPAVGRGTRNWAMTSGNAGASPAWPGVRAKGERAAAAVRGEVDPRGQTAAGPSEGMVVRLADRDPF